MDSEVVSGSPGAPSRRFLVTGATGFVGSHLVRRLSRDGWTGRALVRDRSRAGHLELPGVDLVEGDVCEPGSLDSAFAGVDTVFHCAAVLGPPSLEEARYMEVNAGGTRNMIEVARRIGGIRSFVHLSSVAAIGPSPAGLELNENSSPAPAERYGRSKLASERVLSEAAGDLPVVIARPGWIYGPGSRSTEKLIHAIRRRRFFLIGSATNSHQPLYIDDLVTALLLCATRREALGRCYNLVGPETVTVRELCETLAAVLDRRLPRFRPPARAFRTAAVVAESLCRVLPCSPPLTRRQVDFFVLSFLHSGRRIAEELGWQADTKLEDGMRRTAGSILPASG